MKRRVALALAVLISACTNQTAPIEGGSGLSEMDMTFPPGVGDIYDAYDLEVKATGSSAGSSSCSAPFKKVDSVTEVNFTINHTVSVGCDYMVTILLGKGVSNGKLANALYSNALDGKEGTLVAKADLKEGGTTPVPITVDLINPEANKDLPEKLAGKTNVKINVEIAKEGEPANKAGSQAEVEKKPEEKQEETKPDNGEVEKPEPKDTDEKAEQTEPEAETTTAEKNFTEDATAVRFTIKAGTNGKDWNTAEQYVTAKLGKKLVITNQDLVSHKLFAPVLKLCAPVLDGLNGVVINAGQTVECTPRVKYGRDLPALRDFINHDSSTPYAKFYLEITE